MARRYKGPLQAVQVARLMELTLENAESLIADAQLLYKNDRFARALFLAIVGFEELGKIPLLISGYMRSSDQRRHPWSRFWDKFRRHEPKLMQAVVGHPGVPDPGEAEDHAQQIVEAEVRGELEGVLSDKERHELDYVLATVPVLQKLKEAALYVDFDGAPQSPDIFAPQAEIARFANTMIHVAMAYLAFSKTIASFVPPQRWAEVMEKHRGVVDWNNPKEAARFLISTVEEPLRKARS